jgi:hypothetical protein
MNNLIKIILIISSLNLIQLYGFNEKYHPDEDK